MPSAPDTEYNENFAERAEKTAAMVRDAKYREERDAREQELYRKDRIRAIIRGTIFILVVAIAAIVVDGIRREGGELFAHIVTFVPATSVQRALKDTTEPAKNQMELAHRDVVLTDAKGTATLSFPDGSGILVQPVTRFEVRLLDYARNGRRGRSFFLRYGSIFSRISKAFGSGGQTIISTPNAVAAARGTGYSVFYDTDRHETIVDVIESTVVLKNASGRIDVPAGRRGIATGATPPRLEPLDTARRTELTNLLNRLRKLDQPPLPILVPLLQVEKGIIGFCDPLLQWVGLIPGGWNLQDNDMARQLQAKQRLQDLQKGLADELPEVLTLHTLAEINLPDEERNLILAAFAGESLDSYQKQGTSGYIIRARARDSKNTVYELTETGVREIKK